VLVDLLLDPFDGRWGEVHEAALYAEEAGFDGIWMYDHLAGSVHQPTMCWSAGRP
jgi:alkanesulfonate monooxygenase SsuD/methylene tetrahydromethanopterin reductase-like flavin-dependent oxidoreductase (luciferase family)